MATGVTAFLVEMLCSLYMLVMMLRLLLRFHDADYYNPLTQQLVHLSGWFTRPFNRALPTVVSIETGTVVAMVLFSALATLLLAFLYSAQAPITQVLVWAVIGLLYRASDLYFVAILAMVVLSWVAPMSRHPMADIVRQLSEPISEPFRRIIPALGGLDLSPIFVIIVINIAQRLLRNWAYTVGLPTNIVLGI